LDQSHLAMLLYARSRAVNGSRQNINYTCIYIAVTVQSHFILYTCTCTRI